MEKISFLDPDILRCPFAAYAQVREAGPVYFDETQSFVSTPVYDYYALPHVNI